MNIDIIPECRLKLAIGIKQETANTMNLACRRKMFFYNVADFILSVSMFV